MKYLKNFNTVETANRQGNNGLNSPHVDTIIEKKTTNAANLHAAFTCQFDDEGYMIKSEPDIPHNQIYYYTYDNNIARIDTQFTPVAVSSNTINSKTGLGKITFVSDIDTIPTYFFDCSNITKVIMPNSVKTISRHVFQYSWIEEIYLSNNLETIGEYAFFDTFLKKINFPSSLIEIKFNAFQSCQLFEIKLPDRITTIEQCCFLGSGISFVEIPNSLSILGDNAFIQNAIKKFKGTYSGIINDGKALISGNTFHCYATGNEATDYTVPQNISIIAERAFYDSKNLKKIVFPSTITEFGNEVCANCIGLHEIELQSTIPPSTTDTNFFGNTNNCPIYVPSGSVNTYKAQWHFYEDRIYAKSSPSTFQITYRDAYNNVCGPTVGVIWSGATVLSNTMTNNLGTITFDKEIKVIPIEAFRDSTISWINIPNSVQILDADAFAYCDYLSDITLPNQIVQIGNACFYGDTSLQSINLPSSIQYIGEYAFADSGLREIAFPQGIQKVPDYCCADCSSLDSVTLPDSIIRIGECAFSDCTQLSSVLNSQVIQYIDTQAFYSTTSLTTLNMDALLGVSDNAFENSGIENMNAPLILDVGYRSFYNSKLSTIKLGESYYDSTYHIQSNIFIDAFAHCQYLEHMEFYYTDPPMIENDFRNGSSTFYVIRVPFVSSYCNQWGGFMDTSKIYSL